MSKLRDQDNSPYASNNIQQKVQQGIDLELDRFKIAEQFPANQQLADIHYRANMFGRKKNLQDRICPCCLERVKDQQFQFFGTSMDQSFLSTDVVLFFAFIQMLVYYFLLRFIVSDAYNIFTNYMGNDCRRTPLCVPSIIQKFSIVNKITHTKQLFLVDILNITFVGVSIIYFSSYSRFLYNWYYQMNASIQTQDDFSMFVTNIPIIQDLNSREEMEYVKGIQNYFNQVIRNWLNNPEKDRQLYDDYVKVAMNHGHHPNNPPRIVAKINLCWDLYELSCISEQKQRISIQYQNFKSSNKDNSKRSIIYQDNETMLDLWTLNRAGVDLCQQFQMNKYFGFVISKFLGKAFVSFQYQHFAVLVYQHSQNIPLLLNHRLKVYDASPPMDIFWQNLNVTRWQRLIKQIITFFICVAILLVAFGILMGIKYQQRKFIQDQVNISIYKIILLSVVASIFTLIINWVLKFFTKKLTLFEQHDTKSNYNIAVIYKTISFIIFNQVLVPLLANLLLRNKVWSRNGLTSQITYFIWVSLAVQIVKAITYPHYLWYLIVLKWKLRKAPPILKFQNNYNHQYELPYFEIQQHYIYFLDTLYLVSFYAYIIPFGSLVAVLIYTIKYFADKVQILKLSSFHPSYSYKLLEKCLSLAASSVLVFAVGNYVSSWYFHGKWIQPINMISIGIALVYTLTVWIDSFRKLCIRPHTMYQKASYSDCTSQQKFFHTYFSLNPATKLASDNRKNKNIVGVNYPIQAAHPNMMYFGAGNFTSSTPNGL